MKSRIAIIAGAFLTAFPAIADEWNIGENELGLGVVGADWTISADFPGTKILFDAQYAFLRKPGAPPEDSCCSKDRRSEYYWAIVNAHLQWGVGQTGLEYTTIAVGTWGAQWEPAYDPTKKVQVLRDQVSLGTLQSGHDDPLGIDSHTEFDVVRIDRTWIFKGSPESRFSIEMGLGLTAGWTWASSLAPAYADVSNASSGVLTRVGINHEVIGAFYARGRTVTGFTLGSPATGSSTSREAIIRFGYAKRFKNGIQLDIFIDKRSFNFADPALPDLYTKSKRYGGEVSWRFGKT